MPGLHMHILILLLTATCGVGADVGSGVCECIDPVAAGLIPLLEPGKIGFSGVMLPAEYGTTCGVDVDWWVKAGKPANFGPMTPCASDDRSTMPDWCFQPWCFVDPCSCDLSDTVQTQLFAEDYPSATKLAFSYLTCARCNSRKTAEACSTNDKCIWSNSLQWCEEATGGSTFMIEQCAKRGPDSCGGQSNLNCFSDKGVCQPKAPSAINAAWGCAVKKMGVDYCQCISPREIGLLPPKATVQSPSNKSRLMYHKNALLPLDFGEKCKAWSHPDTAGVDNEKACSGPNPEKYPKWCFDSFCYVDPCTCHLSPSDALQTGMWYAPYPETARQLAYSYATCAQCHNRKTEELCAKHTWCKWNGAFCVSTLDEDYVQDKCAARNEKNEVCGGESNLDCSPGSDGTCNAKSDADLGLAWGCAKFSPWPKTMAPPPKSGGGKVACSTGVNMTFYSFGKDGKLWSFDFVINKWEQIATSVSPQGRGDCALKGSKSMLYLFGGKTASRKFLNDLWAFDIKYRTWEELIPTTLSVPRGRARTALAVLDGKNGNDPALSSEWKLVSVGNDPALIVFAGHTQTKNLDDLWHFSLSTRKWSFIHPSGQVVGPRSSVELVKLDDDMLVMIWGSQTPETKVEWNDVFVLSVNPKSFGRWYQPKVLPDPVFGIPFPRYMAAFVDLPGGGVVAALGWSSQLSRAMKDVWAITKVNLGAEPRDVVLKWKCVLVEEERWATKATRNTKEFPGDLGKSWYGGGVARIHDLLVIPAGGCSLGSMNSLRTLNIGEDKTSSAVWSDACHARFTPVEWIDEVEGHSRGPKSKNTPWTGLDKQCHFQLVKEVPTTVVPPARVSAHSAVQFGNFMLFGGLGEGDRPLNDLWAFDLTLTDGKWTQLTASAESNSPDGTPAGRYKAVFTAWHTQIVIGGGCGDAGCNVRLDDYWSLDPMGPKYSSLPPAPLKLSESCAISHGNALYVYGGERNGATSAELLELDVQRRQWTRLATTDLQSAGCFLDISSSSQTLYVVLGRKGTTTRNWGVAFDLTTRISKEGLSYRSLQFPSGLDNMGRADAVGISLGGELVLLGGKVWGAFPVMPHKRLVKFKFRDTNSNGARLLQGGSEISNLSYLVKSAVDVELDTGIQYGNSSLRNLAEAVLVPLPDLDVELVPSCPLMGFCYAPPPPSTPGGNFEMMLHTAAHYGTQLVIFGGVVNSEKSQQFLIFGWPEQMKCTAGTVLVSSPSGSRVCEHCPSGTYSANFDDRECVKCPPGTANPSKAGTSITACIRCSEGTYADEEGLAECKPCAEDSRCPIGSVGEGIASTAAQSTRGKEIQPERYDRSEAKQKVEDISSLSFNIAAFGLLAVVGLGLIITCTLGARFAVPALEKLDIIISSQTGVKTAPGGLLTLGFVVALIVTLLQLVLEFFLDNIGETQGLLPTKMLESEMDGNMVFDLVIDAVLAGYGVNAACDTEEGKCAPAIKVWYEGLEAGSETLECSMMQDKVPACRIHWVCSECSFVTLNGEVDLVYDDPDAQGHELSVQVIAGSAIPKIPKHKPPEAFEDQQLSMQPVVFTSSPGTLLRGSAPSVVSLLAIPSVYRYESQFDTEAVGLRLLMNSFEGGSEVGPEDISKVHGVMLKVEIEQSITAVLTERNDQKNIEELIGEGSGIFASVLGTAVSIAAFIHTAQVYFVRNRPGRRTYLKISVELFEAKKLRIKSKVTRVKVECLVATPAQMELAENFDQVNDDLEAEFSTRTLSQAAREFEDAQPKSLKERKAMSKDFDSLTEPKRLDEEATKVEDLENPKNGSGLGLDLDEKTMCSHRRSLTSDLDLPGLQWNERVEYYVRANDLDLMSGVEHATLVARFELQDAESEAVLGFTQPVPLIENTGIGVTKWDQESRKFECPLIFKPKRRGDDGGIAPSRKEKKAIVGSLIIKTTVTKLEAPAGENLLELVENEREAEVARRLKEYAQKSVADLEQEKNEQIEALQRTQTALLNQVGKLQMDLKSAQMALQSQNDSVESLHSFKWDYENPCSNVLSIGTTIATKPKKASSNETSNIVLRICPPEADNWYSDIQKWEKSRGVYEGSDELQESSASDAPKQALHKVSVGPNRFNRRNHDILENAQHQTRQELTHAIFKLLDSDKDGCLKCAEMRAFVALIGFDGSDEQWRSEYDMLCNENAIDSSVGVDFKLLMRLIDDKSDNGCYCSDEELRDMFSKLANGDGQIAIGTSNASSASVASGTSAPSDAGNAGQALDDRQPKAPAEWIPEERAAIAAHERDRFVSVRIIAAIAAQNYLHKERKTL